MVLPHVHLLLIDSDAAEVEAITSLLSSPDFTLLSAKTLTAARTLLAAQHFDAVLVDLSLADSKGMETALAVRAVNTTAAVIVLSATQDEEEALESLQLDIQDYLVKDELSGTLLARAIRYAIQRKKDAAARECASRECQELLLQLQSVLENITDGVIIANAAGNIVHMNKEALSFYQYNNHAEARRPLKELQEFFELFDMEGRRVPYEMWPMVRALRGERFSGEDLEVRRKDSGQTWFRSYSGAPVLNDEGKVTLGVMTLRDVTEKTLVERALRAAQAQLEVITERMPVGVARCSRDGRYLWVSPEYARWHAMTPEEIAGRSVREVLGEETYQTISPYLEQVAAGQPVVYEARVMYRGMGYRWVAGRCMPIYDASGALDGWIAVIFDNTSHWEVEEELRRSRERLRQRVIERNAKLISTTTQLQAETEQRVQALEELREKEQMLIQQSRLAAMGEMIGFIAHQWRQPLNLLGLIMQDLPVAYHGGGITAQYLEESAKRGMELISHMSRTIEDFRSFFKMDKEKVQFAVKDVVEQTLNMVQSTFTQQGITVVITADGDDPVEGYPNEFSQAVLNILMNARDAFRDGNVADPTLRIRIFTEEGKTVLTITDNAGGIPPEIIGSIFEPYFTTKSQEQGTGLGLYMAKTIIEKKMGWQLTVKNTADGAQFRIRV